MVTRKTTPKKKYLSSIEQRYEEMMGKPFDRYIANQIAGVIHASCVISLSIPAGQRLVEDLTDVAMRAVRDYDKP